MLLVLEEPVGELQVLLVVTEEIAEAEEVDAPNNISEFVYIAETFVLEILMLVRPDMLSELELDPMLVDVYAIQFEGETA